MDKYVLLILVIITLAISFKILDSFFSANKKQKKKYIYRKKKYLLTKSESYFFDVLQRVMGDSFRIFPQIHLSSILEHRIKGQGWDGAFSHINGKSVDYVLCNKEDYTIVCAIELDDITHNREDRKKRDEEVESIFQQARLPLVRFARKKEFTDEEVKKKIEESIN